jgi:hypothetical protein
MAPSAFDTFAILNASDDTLEHLDRRAGQETAALGIVGKLYDLDPMVSRRGALTPPFRPVVRPPAITAAQRTFIHRLIDHSHDLQALSKEARRRAEDAHERVQCAMRQSQDIITALKTNTT